MATSTLELIKASAADLNSQDPAKRERAKEIKRRYEAGLFNAELQAEGAKPVPVKKPTISAEALKAALAPASNNAAPMSMVPTADNKVSAPASPVKEFMGDISEGRQDLGATVGKAKESIRKVFQNDPGFSFEGGEYPSITVNGKKVVLPKGTQEDDPIVAQTYEKNKGESYNTLQKLMGTMGAVAGGASDIVGDVIKTGVKGALSEQSEVALKQIVESVGKKVNETEVVDDLRNWYGNLDKDNRLIVDSAGGFLKLVTDVAGLKIGSELVPVAERAVNAAGDVVTDATKMADNMVSTAVNKFDDTVAARNMSIATKEADEQRKVIQDTIAPGMNTAEFRKAVEEGRVTRGQEGFFIGKEPDVVEVSDKVRQMSETVQRRIPDAATLDDVGLAKRIDNEIINIATDLEPKMEAVRLRDITPSETPIAKIAKQYKTPDEFADAFSRGELDVDTVERIKKLYGEEVFDDPVALKNLYTRSQNPSMIDVAFDEWERVKTRQMKDPDFIAFAGSTRAQEIFEAQLKKLTRGSKEKTLNDLWKIRKEYDALISQRVKNANENSPISSQIQKQMWLENRKVLNDLINDSARGLGNESRLAFEDMTNMYTAKENIVAKAKADLKGKPGIVGRAVETIKGTADKAIPFSIGAILIP